MLRGSPPSILLITVSFILAAERLTICVSPTLVVYRQPFLTFSFWKLPFVQPPSDRQPNLLLSPSYFHYGRKWFHNIILISIAGYSWAEKLQGKNFLWSLSILCRMYGFILPGTRSLRGERSDSPNTKHLICRNIYKINRYWSAGRYRLLFDCSDSSHSSHSYIHSPYPHPPTSPFANTALPVCRWIPTH